MFPEWSDLGNISSASSLAWQAEASLRERYRYYYDGDVFKEQVPLEQGIEEESPLMYPVGINLVKMLCLAQTDAAFGEWEDEIVSFEARKEDAVDDATRGAIEIAQDILHGSNASTMLWEVALDAHIYGGGAMMVKPNLPKPGHIQWFHIPLQNFYPVWDPDDPDVLLEAYVITPMASEQAKLRYGYEASGEIVYRSEHWTPTHYESKIGGTRIDAYSGYNPWGFVPFVYIPRLRSTNWWGDSLTEDIIPAQDELNMRVADIGESINYNAHPTRWGVNLPRSFNAKNFPLGPNALWDLGRNLGNLQPEVGILETKDPAPEGVFKYVNFLYDWTRTSSFAPPIAFGEDEGSQRSGATLEIRMWPLIKSTRRFRAYLGNGIARALWMSAVMLKQKGFSDIPVRSLDRILKGQVVPRFADVLPRDHVAIVDEVVKLTATNPPEISMETAQKILGRGPGEVERIKEQLKDKELMDALAKWQNKGQDPNQVMNAQAGKMQPQERTKNADNKSEDKKSEEKE